MPEVPVIQDIHNVLAANNWNYVSHRTRLLTQPGENYGSVLLAVDLNYKEKDEIKTTYLVAKLCPPNEVLKKAFITDVTFKKEILSYRDALPAIQNLYDNYNVPSDKQLDVFAKCYGARISILNDFVDDDAVIILENLKLQGYDVENRLTGFDEDFSKLILRNLARWHASTIAIKLRDPKVFQSKIMPCLEEINPGSTMVDGFCDVALHFAKLIDECAPYLDSMRQVVERGKQIGGLKFPFKTNEDYYTMIHVDLWTNNIMIARNNGINSVKFVDFQLLDYGSVARDLLFFLFSSVNINVLDKKLDSYIRFYYDCFVECLLDFNCDIGKFSWDSFNKEVQDVANHELFHMVFMLKPIFSDRGSVGDIDTISKDDFANIDNVGDIYKRRLQYTVVTFGEKGWI